MSVPQQPAENPAFLEYAGERCAHRYQPLLARRCGVLQTAQPVLRERVARPRLELLTVLPRRFDRNLEERRPVRVAHAAHEARVHIAEPWSPADHLPFKNVPVFRINHLGPLAYWRLYRARFRILRSCRATARALMIAVKSLW